LKKHAKLVNSLNLEKLGSYISELLSEHDCVIVPGFGGFVARPVAARFSASGDTLFPPGKSLVFNKNLSNNDGLLAALIMRKESVSYKEASAKLENLVAAAKNALETNKRLELEDLGLLYFNHEKNLLFEPAQKTYEINSFGLMPLRVSKLRQAEEIAEPAVVAEPRIRKSKPLPLRRALRVGAIASSVVLFIFVIFFTARQLPLGKASASLNPFSGKEELYKSQPYGLKDLYIEASRSETENSISSIRLSEKSGRVFIVRADTVHIDKTSVVRPGIPRTGLLSDEYEIVVGCFAVKNNANRLIRQLKSQNIEAVISGQNARGLFVVSVGGFSTETEARNRLTRVKQDLPAAWILKR
jgi:nucleoid DNA-binding protein